jgi:thymidylate synthase (FAD)
MKIIEPAVEIEHFDAKRMLRNIERAGRTCYKSEARITEDSAAAFVRTIVKRGHESVIEHEKITARVVCDRGVSHEIVRHRIASYSQESTRYVNYRDGIEVVRPCFEWNREQQGIFGKAMADAEEAYRELIRRGAKPEEARAVLPTALKTELVMTMNLREWRHFFKMRLSSRAHPQIRQVAFMLLDQMKTKLPEVFGDL